MSAYQKQTLQWLQGKGPAPGSDHRWKIYEEAYLGRLATALTDTLLERVASLFGASFIQSLMCDYVRETPPTHPNMPDLLQGFSTWLARQSWAETHPELVELVALSWRRWTVLIGEDPRLPANIGNDEDALGQLKLQDNHVLQTSALPLFDLWTATDSDQLIAMQAQGVLLYKSLPTTLECMKVPAELFGFLENLSLGLTLFDALQNVAHSPLASETIHFMIRTKALV